jgi:uncharacterized protein (DUF1697 family)
VTRVVALLRGINVGGKHKVTMADLKDAFSLAGCQDVSTYVQSGNVVFTPPSPDLSEVAGQLQRVIADRTGLDVKVQVWTHEELVTVAAANPLAQADPDAAHLHIVFLDAAPAPELTAQLDPDRSPPDRFEVGDRAVYVHYPEGAARSKLTADYFERSLRVAATARNLKTVTKLIDMSSA